VSGDLSTQDAQLLLVFGLRQHLEQLTSLESIRERYPQADLVFASTSGNMLGQSLDDTGLVCTAVHMEKSHIRCASEILSEDSDFDQLCASLVDKLSAPDLRHIFLLSDGSRVNGSKLSENFNRLLPSNVTLSGGLAGDGTDFIKTLVGLNTLPQTGVIVAIGFYGADIQLHFGSEGGWTSFGPERLVTQSENNVLYELDGQVALTLYKTYLGAQASTLPAGALRFPLYVKTPTEASPVVRTILSIDEETGSMTFAGDIPLNSQVRFMHASYEDLIDGALTAANSANSGGARLALCVSCVGRRIVLGQRTEEELEEVQNVLGQQTMLAGFYSYGELAPTGHENTSQLHNQTMTITSIAES
jgi:hypothetical protein